MLLPLKNVPVEQAPANDAFAGLLRKNLSSTINSGREITLTYIRSLCKSQGNYTPGWLVSMEISQIQHSTMQATLPI